MTSFINKWKEFLVNEIFPKIKIIKYSSIQDEENGVIPFISSSSMNNGISGYSNAESFTGKCISVSTNGKCFDCFFQDGTIGVSTDVEILTNNHLNKYNALFICTILKQESFKWCYGRKPKNDKVFFTKIKLPTTSEGKPDWKYMENFIRKITDGKNFTFGKLSNSFLTTNVKPAILKSSKNSTDVKTFTIGQLFGESIYKAKAYAKIDLDQLEYPLEGYLPFVSRTEFNNSVDCYIKNNGSLTIEDGNCLVIGDTTATISYQEKPFVCGDHIVICRPKWLNKYIALYIKTLLDQEKYRYSYGRAFKKEFIINTKILLPIDKSGNPDFQYMEEYIKSLPFSDKI